MYFPTIVTFTALPFLMGAVSGSLNSPRTDGLISIPLSKRSTYLNGDGSVDLEKLQAGAHHTKARFDQAFSVYERNTGEPHPLALKRGHSNERRVFVPVNLTGAANLVMGDIQIGTPAQTFNVHFDTISPDVFLSGPSCSTCNGHKIWDPSTSSSAAPIQVIKGGANETIKVSDNFQSLDIVNGSAFSDTLVVAGFKVPNQPILVAEDIGPALRSPQFTADGVVGLGFAELSFLISDSFFGTLISNKGLGDGQPVFGLFLADSGSELVIGGTDTTKFSGALTHVKISRKGVWQIQMDSISVNGNDISISNKEVVLDSSSIAISGDPGPISDIYAKIPGSARMPDSIQWTIPCNTDVIVSVTFGGTKFNILPSTYNLGAVSSGNSTCVGGFNSVPLTAWSFGTVFLKNVYTEFDQTNSQVGFAQAVTSD